jgi:tRNA G18 (ribose-2'-O)-methylase SpoU
MKESLITARSNPWVQQWLRYQAKPSARKAAGLVWLEGEHLVQEALKQTQAHTQLQRTPRFSGFSTFSVLQWVLPHTASGQAMLATLQAAHGLTDLELPDIIWLGESVYKALCSMDSLPSVCAVLQINSHAEQNNIDYSKPAVVLDGLQDPGNIGTAIRLCAAFGMPQLLLSAGCASAWSAKALRAGQGAQLAISVYEDVDLNAVYSGFKAQNLPIFATSLSGNSVSLANFTSLQDTSVNVSVSKPCVWVFGNEGQGISEASQAAATQCVHIPMQGGFESLNVGSAVAICLWTWQQMAG